MLQKLMPIMFVGHGSPMNAIADNVFTKNFKKAVGDIDAPKAIVCISAHWFTDGTKVTSMDSPKTIHDFFGFPKELYEINYPAKGDKKLAEEIKELLSPIHVETNNDWGLDHGTWSVLTHMYSKADIPVVQISIDYNKPPEYHFELAKKLKVLREKGILVIGSGNIIHNLNLVDFENIDTINFGYAWAKDARKTINEAILSGNYEPLFNYENEGKNLNLAIPTPEHFLPLLYILGLKEKDEKIEIFNDSLVGGSLSMTSLKIS